jgi:hypothetical protein
MATATDVRNWLKGEGHPVSVKGSIPSWGADAWNDAHPEDQYGQAANGNGQAAPDYPEGMSDADFETVTADMPDLPEDAHGTGETKPARRKPAAKASPWKRFQRGQAKGKPKPKRPRVPVDDLICSAWRIMARVAPGVPLQRVFRVQAPVAGALLEDVVRDTVVDRVMQPVARLQMGGKTAVALAGPPMLVLAITMHVARQAAEGKPPNPMFMQMAGEMLREALLIWMDVAGPKFEAALQREKEFEEKYGRPVDDMIAFIFSEPPASEEAAQAEEDAIRRAQSFVARS